MQRLVRPHHPLHTTADPHGNYPRFPSPGRSQGFLFPCRESVRGGCLRGTVATDQSPDGSVAWRRPMSRKLFTTLAALLLGPGVICAQESSPVPDACACPPAETSGFYGSSEYLLWW